MGDSDMDPFAATGLDIRLGMAAAKSFPPGHFSDLHFHS